MKCWIPMSATALMVAGCVTDDDMVAEAQTVPRLLPTPLLRS